MGRDYNAQDAIKNIEALDDDLTDALSRIENLEKERDALKDSLDEAEGQISELQNENSDLQMRLKAYEDIPSRVEEKQNSNKYEIH